MSVLCAILLGLAVIVTQALHGGLLVAALADPGRILLVLAGVLALAAVIRGRGQPAPGAMLAVAVFLGYLAWRCMNAPDAFLGRVEMGQVLACGLAFFVVAAALTSVRAKYVLLGILGAAALAQAVLGFLQFAHKGDAIPIAWFSLDLKAIYSARFLNRAHGFFMNPNQFAWLETWAALFAMALACWGRVSVLARVVLIYLAMVFVAVVVLSSSRGGVVALLGGFTAFAVASIGVVMMTLRRGRLAVIAGAVLLLTACLSVGGWVYASNWVSQGRVEDALQSHDVRALYYAEAWRQFQVEPLLGAGPEMFRYAARLYRLGIYWPEVNDPVFVHSDWLQTLAEYGFVGFALAGAALGILLVGGLRRFFAVVRDRAASDARPFSNSGAMLLGAFSATVAFAIHSAVDFNMHVPANALLAAVTLGLLAGGGMEGEPKREVSRRVRAMILRIVAGSAVLVLGAALGGFVWRHAFPDFQNLQARNAFVLGNVRETLSVADAGLRREPDHAGLLEMRGKALYAMESAMLLEEDSGGEDDDAELPPEKRSALYRDAAQAFSQALRWQPLERQYHVELAKALVENGRVAEAHAHFVEAIRLDPAQEYAYGAYGDQLDDEEAFPRALRIFEIGAQTPLAKYCAARVDDVREELTPPPEDDTQPPSAEDEKPNGGENSDKAGALDQ
jgi:O-antigen ligase